MTRYTANIVIPEHSNVLAHRLAAGLAASGYTIPDTVTTGVDGGIIVQGDAPDLDTFTTALARSLPPDLVIDDVGECA